MLLDVDIVTVSILFHCTFCCILLWESLVFLPIIFHLSPDIMSFQRQRTKLHSLKCHNYCYDFDLHNHCNTCREAGNGDDTCVTGHRPCLL